MSLGKISLTHVVVLFLLIVVPLVLILWASRQNATRDNASARGASVVSTGTVAPPTSPTPQGTRTPRLVELSPVVINLETAEALGFSPTHGPTVLAQIEEADLYHSLYTRAGVIIAQGTNSTPTADGITSYRIEEVVMTGTATITWEGERVTFDRLWRLTITGPTFGTYYASHRYTIWIDQNLLGPGNARNVPGEVTALAFDRSLLPEGAAISVSLYETVTLSKQVPERIHYLPTSPQSQETQTPVIVELSPIVMTIETAEALGLNPTPGPGELAQIEEANLYYSLYTRPGVLIAQGTNSTPTADGLTTYRIEEVVMTGTVSLTWQEEIVTFDRFWRLTISGPAIMPFYSSRRYTVWIDQNLLSHGSVHNVPGEVTAIAFDRALLPEGATISVSQFNSVSISSQVPETIHYRAGP